MTRSTPGSSWPSHTVANKQYGNTQVGVKIAVRM